MGLWMIPTMKITIILLSFPYLFYAFIPIPWRNHECRETSTTSTRTTTTTAAASDIKPKSKHTFLAYNARFALFSCTTYAKITYYIWCFMSAKWMCNGLCHENSLLYSRTLGLLCVCGVSSCAKPLLVLLYSWWFLATDETEREWEPETVRNPNEKGRNVRKQKHLFLSASTPKTENGKVIQIKKRGWHFLCAACVVMAIQRERETPDTDQVYC